GYGLGGRVEMVVALPFVGVSMALLTLVGVYKGASRHDLVVRVSRYAIKRTLLAAVVMGCLVFIFAEPILRIFTNEPAVIEVGKSFLRYLVFAYPIVAFCMNSGRILQGLGLGLPSLVITSTRVILVAVPLGYLFTRIWGMEYTSVWVALLISGCVATLISVLWLRSRLAVNSDDKSGAGRV
ncbi:MATE family efflux transporter, partial [Thermodesulfobacteriota bacterium]